MIEVRWIFWFMATLMMLLWGLWWLMLIYNGFPLLVYFASPLMFGAAQWEKGLENRRIIDLTGSSALVVLSLVAIHFQWGERESLLAVQTFLVLTIALLRKNFGFWLWMALNLVWMFRGHWGWMVANDVARLGTVWWPARLLDESGKADRSVRRFETTVIYVGLAVLSLLAELGGLGPVTFGQTAPGQSAVAAFVLPLLIWLGLILAAVFER